GSNARTNGRTMETDMEMIASTLLDIASAATFPRASEKSGLILQDFGMTARRRRRPDGAAHRVRCDGQAAAEQQQMLQGYQKRQVWLRQQIRLLKAGKLKCGGSEPLTRAVIRRTERQAADLDRAVARLRKQGGRDCRRGISASI